MRDKCWYVALARYSPTNSEHGICHRSRLRVEIVRLCRCMSSLPLRPLCVPFFCPHYISLPCWENVCSHRSVVPVIPNPQIALYHVLLVARSVHVAVELSSSYMPMSDPRFCLLLLYLLFICVLVKWSIDILLYLRRPSEPNTKTRYLRPRVCASPKCPLPSPIES